MATILVLEEAVGEITSPLNKLLSDELPGHNIVAAHEAWRMIEVFAELKARGVAVAAVVLCSAAYESGDVVRELRFNADKELRFPGPMVAVVADAKSQGLFSAYGCLTATKDDGAENNVTMVLREALGGTRREAAPAKPATEAVFA